MEVSRTWDLTSSIPTDSGYRRGLKAINSYKCDRKLFRPKYSHPAKTNRTASAETRTIPLVTIDALEGRTNEEIKTLLDAAHRAKLAAFGVPLRDRYQMYQMHRRAHMVIQDTGLGIARTDSVVAFTIFSKQRTEPLKVKLYAEPTRELQSACLIAPRHVMACIIENSGATGASEAALRSS